MKNMTDSFIQSKIMDNYVKDRLNREWIKCLKNVCIQESLHTGIYPSVTVGIAILESFFGTSELAVNHYNFFGMTMHPCLLGNTITFWDGMNYTGAKVDGDICYADYTQAGDYGRGFLMSLRHFGFNFWATPQYGCTGVLNHISSGLTQEEARNDAIKQLIELQPIYDPHEELEGDFIYTRDVMTLIDQYDLWEYDKRFLELGGWNGKVPYYFNHHNNGSRNHHAPDTL